MQARLYLDCTQLTLIGKTGEVKHDTSHAETEMIIETLMLPPWPRSRKLKKYEKRPIVLYFRLYLKYFLAENMYRTLIVICICPASRKHV